MRNKYIIHTQDTLFDKMLLLEQNLLNATNKTLDQN